MRIPENALQNCRPVIRTGGRVCKAVCRSAALDGTRRCKRAVANARALEPKNQKRSSAAQFSRTKSAACAPQCQSCQCSTLSSNHDAPPPLRRGNARFLKPADHDQQTAAGPAKKTAAAAAPVALAERPRGSRHGARHAEALEGLLLLRVTNWFGPIGRRRLPLRPL